MELLQLVILIVLVIISVELLKKAPEPSELISPNKFLFVVYMFCCVPIIVGILVAMFS